VTLTIVIYVLVVTAAIALTVYVVELIHVDSTGDTDVAAVLGEVAAATPTNAHDQGAAHKVVADWPADVHDAWLRNWGIDEFSEAWPAEAVTDALTQPF
jgi:hypothetical protein